MRAPAAIALPVFVSTVLVFLYAPVLLLMLFSFNDSTIVAFPLTAPTLRWYRTLLTDGSLVNAVRNSLAVAALTSVCATALAAASAYVMDRFALLGSGLLTGVAIAGMIVPPLVLGASLLVLVTGMAMPLSLGTIFIGHMVVCTPFALIIMRSTFAGQNRELEEASRDLGASQLQTFLKVSLPLAASGLAASLLVTFTLSLDEFVLSYFLAGSDVTLPVYMWSQLRFPQKLPPLLAMATLQLVLSAVLLLLAARIGRARRKFALR